MVTVDACSATRRLSRDVARLTPTALEHPAHLLHGSPFSQEVEIVRQHLRLFTDRELLAESYARESSVILREGTLAPDCGLETDPVVIGYAIRWFEVGGTTGGARSSEWVGSRSR